ncbi:MAG: WYL domain-containing protein [Armatimonadetes bacterium]|nr:WYL domain-containing protein [Armatimonadota bacterium]
MQPDVPPRPPASIPQWARILWLDREIRAGRYPNAARMRQEFGGSRRTVFNAVAHLRDSLGAPVRYSRARGGWYYEDATYALPAVFLAQGELLSLVLAQEVSRQYLGTPLEAPLRAAVEKICAFLPDTVSVALVEISDRFCFAGASGLEVPLELFTILQQAIRERRAVRILYYTASRDEMRERVVEPHFFRNVRGDWMVVAWDRWRQTAREFMLARVHEYALLPERFERQPDLTPERYQEHMFLTERGDEPWEVALRFDAYQARWIRERRWHPTQRLEELPGGELALRLTVSGEGDLVRWILGYGGHVRVLEPEWLRERVGREHREAASLPGERTLEVQDDRG